VSGDKNMSEFILEMKNITKEFPGVKALDNVNLKVKKISGGEKLIKACLQNVLREFILR
jgi:ABC-type uncharacterized transport system ATPase subunit